MVPRASQQELIDELNSATRAIAAILLEVRLGNDINHNYDLDDLRKRMARFVRLYDRLKGCGASSTVREALRPSQADNGKPTSNLIFAALDCEIKRLVGGLSRPEERLEHAARNFVRREREGAA